MQLGEIYCIRWVGGSYVGQTRVRSTARWTNHIMLLKSGKHHNPRLQEAFYSVGLCGLSFSVLEAGVSFEELDDREDFWTDKLESVNAKSLKATKADKSKKVLELLKGGKTYREISKMLGISLGTISNIRLRELY